MQLDYVEKGDVGTYNVPVNTDPTAVVWLQGNPITFDGSTRICVEAYCGAVEPDFQSGIVFDLYDGATNLGAIMNTSTGEDSGNITRDASSTFGRTFFTPTAGAHTFSIRVWAVKGTTNNIYSGTLGGAGSIAYLLTSYYRVTTA